MSSKPIALVFGYGANIGSAVARRFARDGYRLAVVSRRGPEVPQKNEEGFLHIKANLADTETYETTFQQVKQHMGGIPSVVVYNAASFTPPTDPENLFTIPLEEFNKDLNLMVTGPYVAAREAMRLWNEQNDGGKKFFIYTGNMLPKKVLPVPQIATLGIGKTGAYYWLDLADQLYKSKGIRFFFADQRMPDGSPMGSSPGPEEHAKMFSNLTKEPDAYPSYVTFTNGARLVNFQ